MIRQEFSTAAETLVLLPLKAKCLELFINGIIVEKCILLVKNDGLKQ